MNISRIAAAAVLVGAAVTAQGTLSISLGIRETGAAGGSFTAIGDDGGFSGGIEFVDLDVQTLTLDGTWQTFTFDLANATLTGFAGATANNLLDGDFGTIEHVRIRNSGGVTGPIQLWIDDVVNTITPSGGSPTPNVVADFEGYAQGDEVMFQEPGFSGSTSSNILAGATAGVDNFVASTTPSDAIVLEFVDNTATRWVRLTTFQSANVRNPLIRFDQSSVITFRMRGGVAQENLFSNGPGDVIAEHVGTGLNAGEQSTYYVAGAEPGAAGALFFSIAGQNDLPILGGNLVSFQGNIIAESIGADASGRISLVLPGDPAVLDLVVQTAFLDSRVPFGVAFSNAVLSRYGQ